MWHICFRMAERRASTRSRRYHFRTTSQFVRISCQFVRISCQFVRNIVVNYLLLNVYFGCLSHWLFGHEHTWVRAWPKAEPMAGEAGLLASVKKMAKNFFFLNLFFFIFLAREYCGRTYLPKIITKICYLMCFLHCQSYQKFVIFILYLHHSNKIIRLGGHIFVNRKV